MHILFPTANYQIIDPVSLGITSSNQDVPFVSTTLWVESSSINLSNPSSVQNNLDISLGGSNFHKDAGFNVSTFVGNKNTFNRKAYVKRKTGLSDQINF